MVPGVPEYPPSFVARGQDALPGDMRSLQERNFKYVCAGQPLYHLLLRLLDLRQVGPVELRAGLRFQHAVFSAVSEIDGSGAATRTHGARECELQILPCVYELQKLLFPLLGISLGGLRIWLDSFLLPQSV